MALRSPKGLDSLDWKILRELQADARLSYNEVARRVGLSSPTVVERVRRMEDAGVITGYHARIDPARVGLPVMALVQLRCESSRCLLKTTTSGTYPEVIEVLKVSGDHCTVLKVVAASTAHLEDVFARLGEHGPLQTTMVWSAALSRRPIDWEDGIPEFGTPPDWNAGGE